MASSASRTWRAIPCSCRSTGSPTACRGRSVAATAGTRPRAELLRRAIAATLTRSTDTLIDLTDRGALCKAACDLFVSIHVNAMPDGRRADRVSGVETYFLSDAKTEDQQRVAQVENEAIRFETGTSSAATGPLGFILRDLQVNEYLRESAQLARLVQDSAAGIHPGCQRGLHTGGL